jgi:hypothetical protein
MLGCSFMALSAQLGGEFKDSKKNQKIDRVLSLEYYNLAIN